MARQTLDLGRRPYAEVLALQRERLDALRAGRGEEILILCEHPPVITLGTSARNENLLVDERSLRQKGVDIFTVERGGDVTYHGPGQLVAYPILDLRSRRTDVGWYMRTLEEAIIRTLAAFAISADRLPKETGVWTGGRKIASLGVKLSRWCTMHGLALNVSNECLEGFRLINPCGFAAEIMTCMGKELQTNVELEEVKKVFVKNYHLLLG